MKRTGMFVLFSAACLIHGAATAQNATNNDSACQAAFDASPASKTCEIGLSPGRAANVCSGVAKCGEGSYHMFFDLSIAETKQLVDCSGTVTPMGKAPASCLTPEQKSALEAEKAKRVSEVDAEKSACNDAWGKSSAAKSCTARVDRSEYGGGTCAITAQCQPGSKENSLNRVSIQTMTKLENCAGKLQDLACGVTNETAYEAQRRESEERRLWLQSQATQTQAQYETHDAMCLAAWKASSAQATCVTTELMTRHDGNMCGIHAQCAYGERLVSGAMSNLEVTESGAWVPSQKEKRDNVLSVSEDDLRKLVNCEGTLKVGSCD